MVWHLINHQTFICANDRLHEGESREGSIEILTDETYSENPFNSLHYTHWKAEQNPTPQLKIGNTLET